MGTIHEYEEKMVGGMVRRGYDPEFANNCFNQIKGFGEYGFPESHAAAFAHLVYVSAWIKCFYPDVFAAALLNSQPMGFYAPAQIIRDARDHGVEVRHPDVNQSDWDCTLEGKALTSVGGPRVPSPLAGEGGASAPDEGVTRPIRIVRGVRFAAGGPLIRKAGAPPHPAFQATFSREGRRDSRRLNTQWACSEPHGAP